MAISLRFRRRRRAALRAADRRLFVEDALVVTAVTGAVAAVLVVVYLRKRRATSAFAWSVAALGAVLWLGGPITAPSIDAASLHCTNARTAPSESAAGNLAIRGWSWTRFSQIVVRTDPSGMSKRPAAEHQLILGHHRCITTTPFGSRSSVGGSRESVWLSGIPHRCFGVTQESRLQIG